MITSTLNLRRTLQKWEDDQIEDHEPPTGQYPESRSLADSKYDTVFILYSGCIQVGFIEIFGGEYRPSLFITLV